MRRVRRVNRGIGLRIGMVLAAGVLASTVASAGEDTALQPVHPDAARRRPHQPVGRPGPEPVPDTERVPDERADPWWKWEHATGDWLGLRPALVERGVTLEIGYSADWFTNTYGGLNTADAHVYRGLLDIALTIDTEAMGLWDGGTFFIDFQNIHGRDISERYVGDLQALNNADAPDRTQVAEYWYEQALFDGKLRFKIGKMDVNADFAYVDYGLEFIHSSPGFHPNIPMPTYPDPALAAAMFVEPVEWFYAGAGVYDATGTGNRWDFESALHGPDDSFTVFEIGLRPAFRVAGQELPGVYRVGGWYHSGTWDVFFDDRDGRRRPITHRGNAGMYLAFDQMLLREHPDAEDDEQGLGAFFQFGWAPARYNEISQYYGGGFQYTGLIPARDEDITGIGLFHASLSGRVQSLEQRYSETAVELFHKIQLTPFLSVKPDLQYIVDPGGAGRDALAAGVRMEMAF